MSQEVWAAPNQAFESADSRVNGIKIKIQDNMDEVAQSLAQLSLSSDPKKELRHLKTTLLGLSSSRNTALPQDINLRALFDAFNTSDKWVFISTITCLFHATQRLTVDIIFINEWY